MDISLKQLFAKLDLHHKGYLEAELVEDLLERHKLWRHCQTRFSEAANRSIIHAIMHRVDRDRDGSIDLDEFVRVLRFKEFTLDDVDKEKGSQAFKKSNPNYTNLRTNRSQKP